MTSNQSSQYDVDRWADFWYYEIGVNVIPADTKNKIPLVPWRPNQNKPIPKDVFEQWKKEGKFNKGLAIICGKIWRGRHKGKYLNAIDCDNKKAIDEICTYKGKKLTLPQFAKWTLVEQHKDDLTKAHIYIISEKPFKKKSSDKVNPGLVEKIGKDEIPAIEVKGLGEHGIMFATPSVHKNGWKYEIIGIKKPILCDEFEKHIDNILGKYGIEYLSSSSDTNNDNTKSSLTPIEELFKPDYKVLEGRNRHEALLRIMESLLKRNLKTLEISQIKNLSYEWNQKHCVPPLDNKEFERQWKDAQSFVEKSNENNSKTGVIESSDNTIKKYKIMSSSNLSTSCAKNIVDLTLENSTLLKNEFEQPHALVKINNHYEVLSMDSSKFENYLSKLYYDKNEKQVANAESINNAIRMLKAQAIFEGKTMPLHLRLAWSNNETKDTIYYDLSDENRRSIKITKDMGWKIVENQFEVLFKRYGHQSAQVEPSHDYDKEIFDKFINSLNIKNEGHKLLVKVWITSLLIPEIAHPILLPYGEKGSAKSTLLKKIKMLIDPSQLDLFSVSRDKTQFIQQMTHNFLCFYDNVRYEPNWLSDEACRAVTGGSFSKRKLYSDDDDIPYRYKKILGFAGINVIFKEPDALDRSIKIELERIREENNIPDSKIEQELKQQIPQLLGFLFDIISKTLQIKDSVKLNRLPRMADFAEWGEAIARALGYKPLEFMDAYFENLGEQNIEIIESNPYAEAISKFVDYEKLCWTGSPKSLTKDLTNYADNNDIDSSKFPKTATSVSQRLNKIKSNLREGLGIEITVGRITSGNGNKKLMNTAIIKIRKLSPVAPVAPVAPENDTINEGKQDFITGAKNETG
ncbi:MAG: bifunctional DNA primase/polymerase, partial [Nitrososphaeraceae archaeon]